MAKEVVSGIYSIRFPGSPNSIYIGQSKDVAKRWKEHLSTARTGKQSHLPIYRAFAKYGIENAIFTILEQCSEDELLLAESIWDSRFKGRGYKMYNTLAGEMKANSEALAVAHGGSSFYLKNWETNELEWFASSSECARKTGFRHNNIQCLREGKGSRGVNIYSMGQYTLPDCERPPRLQKRPKSGRVKLTKGDQVLVFPNQAKAAAFLGVTRVAITNAVRRGGKCKGYIVTQDDE